MISDKSALSNTEEVGYTSPVKSVYETMISGEYEGVSSYIPDFENPNSEIFLLSGAEDQAEICGAVDEDQGRVNMEIYKNGNVAGRSRLCF